MYKDYILRIIAQFTAVIARIIGLKEIHQTGEALALIDQNLQSLCGLDSKTINTLSAPDLLRLMRLGGSLDNDKCMMIGVLLKTEADIYDADGWSAESYPRYIKALYLLLAVFLDSSANTFADYFSAIDEMIQKMDRYEMPAELKRELIPYFEQTGNYAKGEDLLYELLEPFIRGNAIPEPDSPDDALVEQGIEFYERLLSKSDRELNTGNLARAEVYEALAQLRAIP